MAVPFIAASGAAWTVNDSGGNVESLITLTKPTDATIDNGDLLLIIVGSDDANPLAGEWNAVTGWTREFQIGDNTTDVAMAVYWRIADGTEGATQGVTCDTTNELYGWYIHIQGNDDTTPMDANGPGTEYNAVGTSHAVTGFTVAANDRLAFTVGAFDGGDGHAFTVSGTGWTLGDSQQSGSGASDASGMWATKDVTSGATGTCTVTSAVTDGLAGIQFAIASAAGGPTEETLAATATVAATLARRASLFRTLAATATGAATLAFSQAFSSITNAATATGAATLNTAAALVNRTLSAAATGVATLIEDLGATLTELTLAATAAVTATLNRAALFFRTLKPASEGTAPAVDFDGAAGSGFDDSGSNAGLTDGKELSWSFWIRRDTTGTPTILSSSRKAMVLQTTDRVDFLFQNAAGGVVYRWISANNAVPTEDVWHHVCGWVNTAATDDYDNYIDGVQDSTVATTFVLDGIFRNQDVGSAIGQNWTTGASNLDGGLSQLALWERKIDWSNSSTIELVRTSDGKAVVLPDDGDIDSGGAAAYVFNKDEANAHTNDGTANDWAEGVGTSDTTGPATAAGGSRIVTTLNIRQDIRFAATAIGAAVLAFQKFVNRVLGATATGTATLLRLASVSRALSAVSTGVATIIKRAAFSRIISAAATGIATLIEQLISALTEITLAATATVVAVLERRLRAGRTLAVTATGSATLLIQGLFRRVMSATATVTATVNKRWLALRTLSTTATGAAVLAFSQAFTQVVLSATTAVTATLARRWRAFRAFAATVTATATMIADQLGATQITLAATAAAVATLNKLGLFFRTVSATATGVATALKNFSTVTLPAAATGLVTLIAEDLAATLVTLAATATGVATLARQRIAPRIVSAVATGVVTITNAFPFSARVFSAIATVIATEKNSPHAVFLTTQVGSGHYGLIGGEDNFQKGDWELINGGAYEQIGPSRAFLLRGFFKTLAAAATGIATLVQGIPVYLRTLAATATGVATLARRALFRKVFIAVSTGIATLFRRATYVRLFSATATGIATLIELLISALTEITLAATATGVATIQRLVTAFRTLAVTATGAATLLLSRAFTSIALVATSTASATLARVALLFKTLAATATGVATLVRELVVPLTDVVLTATSTAVATIQSLYQQFVQAFTGHGGLGLGDKLGRWRRRRGTWKRRK